MTALKIPAAYMRGGTSKGVFFLAEDVPADLASRSRVLRRVIGSPDPYGKHSDGMGGATSSTSKVVLVSRSQEPGCDIDYTFGQVAMDRPVVDWSGSCGNLVSAAAAFAVRRGLLPGAPRNGTAHVRIWQANLGKRINVDVPVLGGLPQEEGQFVIDGVAFPAAEIRVEFFDPAGSGDIEGGGLLPTGHVVDELVIDGAGAFRASLIDAGMPTIIVTAASLGLAGDELQDSVNTRSDLLDLCEAIRAAGAVAMGLAETSLQATETRPHSPKLAFVAPPAAYRTSSGKTIAAGEIDILARIISMGKLHHAMTGTGGVAIASAAVVPGTIVAEILGGAVPRPLRLGHTSGITRLATRATERDGSWHVESVTVSSSARLLMEGHVFVPQDTLTEPADPPDRLVAMA